MEDLLNKKHFLYDDKIGSVELVQFMGEDITIVNSARVSFGVHKDEIDDKDKKLITSIKKSDLAKDAADARPEVFSKDNALDAKITELDLENRKIKLNCSKK